MQVIEGFAHLEEKHILHRDIRESNILITDDGAVKIIDFGFGKQAVDSADFDKSISLNWWCALPPEFALKVYDHVTEVYFVGKLIEVLIDRHLISNFQYDSLLRRMAEPIREKRIESFAAVRQEILSQPRAMQFSDEDVGVYRWFTQTLVNCISKVGARAAFNPIDQFQLKLEDAYKSVMLETSVPDCSVNIECFLAGNYRYFAKRNFPVECLRDFLELLRRCTKEQRNIVEANLRARINALPKLPEAKSGFDDMDDDIPF